MVAATATIIFSLPTLMFIFRMSGDFFKTPDDNVSETNLLPVHL